jgi:WD40 repeat protein
MLEIRSLFAALVLLGCWPLGLSAGENSLKTSPYSQFAQIRKPPGAAPSTNAPLQSITDLKKSPLNVVPVIGRFGDIGDVIITPDKHLIAISTDTGVQLWDLDAARLLRTLKYRAFFRSIKFINNGSQIVSTHANGEIKFWDVRTGNPLKSLNKPALKDEDVDFGVWSSWMDANGQMIVAGIQNGDIMISRSDQTQPLRKVRIERDYSRVTNVTLTKNNTILTATSAHTIKSFDVKSGKVLESVSINENVWFRQNGLIDDDHFFVEITAKDCAISTLAIIVRRDWNNPTIIDKPSSCEKPKTDEEAYYKYGTLSLFYDATRRHALITRDGISDMRLFDLTTLSTVKTLKSPSDGNDHMAAAFPELQLGVTNGDTVVKVFDLDTGQPYRQLKIYNPPPTALLYQAIVATYFFTMRLLRTRKLICIS